MPKVCVYKDPEKIGNLPEAFTTKLSQFLMFTVSKSFDLPSNWVQVIFVPVEKAVNAPPLGIEISYSVTEKVHPNKKVRDDLVYVVTETVISMKELPDEVDRLTCWVLPQHEASFRQATRKIK